MPTEQKNPQIETPPEELSVEERAKATNIGRAFQNARHETPPMKSESASEHPPKKK